MPTDAPAPSGAPPPDDGPAGHLPDDRLRAVAARLLEHPFEGWFYGDSIGFEGLLAAGDLLADPSYRGFVRGFLRGWATRARPYRELDNTVPGVALCAVAERTGDRSLVDLAIDLAGHLSSRPTVGPGVYVSFASAPLREPYGGAELPPEERDLLLDPGPGVYVDCLHFDPPFLGYLGRLMDDEALRRQAVAQALGYVALLQDPDTGLFRHFWLDRTGRPYVRGWSRGQGWALLGLLDVVEAVPASEPGREALVEAIRALASGMLETQRPDGHWCALASDTDAPFEASAAPFMATGFARGVRLGVLDERYAGPARRAWAATVASLRPDGVLGDVSAAVWSSTQESHYRHVGTGHTVPWGQGPVLTAALAMRRLAGGPGT